jgi:mxaA protein
MPEPSTRTSLRWWVAALALITALACAAASPALLNTTTREPRAFGYQVGDLVSRSVSVYVPAGLVLVDASVPQPGARGQALELRRVARESTSESAGRRIEIRLDYQVFLAPLQVRTLEMPSFTLRFKGRPRDQEVRVEAWPVTVAPLVPPEVSPRNGLGELQPDAATPLIDTTAARQRLVVYALALLLLSGCLAFIYLGVPWWSRTHRPFARAWRALRRIAPPERRLAFRQVHEALNRTAGEVLFASGVDRFVAAHPRFQPLRDDLTGFFERSRLEFFGDGAPRHEDAVWLLDFCRRCRDAERGSA